MRGALTQGIGVATGLQSKFSWAGVAAAGISAGVGGAVGSSSFGQSLGKYGNQFVSGMAGGIAGAAATSLVTGQDFGDTLMNNLPSIIGNTIGNLVADRLTRSPKIAYEDVGTDDSVTGGGASTAGSGTTGSGDGTSAQPVAGGAGGGQTARGISSRERHAANDTSSSEGAVNEIVVTADSSKLKFLRSMNDGMYRIWTSELNFISKGDDYYYGNPFRMKGGVTYLIGGAGNDPNREYLNKMTSSFERAGIENIQIVGDSASGGYILDAASVILTNQAHSYSEYMRPVNVKVPDGQLNFVGYSWGSIQAAHTALRFAGNGYNVDNVVLIGAPLEQSLVNKLATDPHIGRVTVINLTEFGDPIHAGMSDFQFMKAVPELSRTVGTGTGHFSFAGTGFTADARRDALGNILYYNGVR